MAAVIGSLRVNLGLDSAAFQDGLKKSQSTMIAFGKKLAVVGVGIATAGAAAFAGFNRAVDVMGNLQKQADIAGLSAQEFKIASLAVQQYGVEQEKLSDILKDVNEKFGDFAATGGGELKDFFDNIAPKVGLTIDSFKNLSSSDALALYVTALQDANVSQQEMTFYMEALANDATALVPAFQNGGQAIKDMTARAQELGLAIDEELIAKSRTAQGDINLMSDVISTQLNQALLELGPSLSQLAAALMPLAGIISTVIDKTLLWTDVAGDFVREGVLGIDRALAQMAQTAVAAMGEFGRAVVDGLNAAGTAALTGAVTIIDNIVTGLVGIVKAAADAVTAFEAALRAGLAHLAASAVQWGKDIVQGIINGVKSMVGALRDTVTRMASDAAAAVTDFFKIKSPSRLMMDYGQNIAAGLGIGVEQGKSGPIGAMQDMAQGMSGVFKGMLLEGASFGDSMRSMLSGLFSGWADKAWNAGWSGLMGAIGLPSFSGGGFTGNAARAGGMDGKGGFLAMMHPRETVIDHTRSAGAGTMAVRVYVDDSDQLRAMVDRRAGQQSARMAQQVESRVPAIMDNHQKRSG